MRAFLRRLDADAERYLMLVFYCTVVFVIVNEVVRRFVLQYSSLWGEEVARYAFIYLGWVGAAQAVKERAHIRFDTVLQLLPVNDASYTGPSPYAPVSAFALDPVYLSLDECEDFVAAGGREALAAERRDQIAELNDAARVDWPAVRALKREAIDLAFQRFLRDEWSRSIAMLLVILQQETLLERNPMLARTIRDRFPYIDPLNHVQIELLRRHRAGDTAPEVVQGIHLSINGIAAGLRNSG